MSPTQQTKNTGTSPKALEQGVWAVQAVKQPNPHDRTAATKSRPKPSATTVRGPPTQLTRTQQARQKHGNWASEPDPDKSPTPRGRRPPPGRVAGRPPTKNKSPGRLRTATEQQRFGSPSPGGRARGTRRSGPGGVGRFRSTVKLIRKAAGMPQMERSTRKGITTYMGLF